MKRGGESLPFQLDVLAEQEGKSSRTQGERKGLGGGGSNDGAFRCTSRVSGKSRGGVAGDSRVGWRILAFQLVKSI